MTILAEKSEQNLEAAGELKELGYDASGVHCAYYSCIQFMLHIKLQVFGESTESLLKRSQEEGLGSHQLISNELKVEIYNRSTDPTESRDFTKSVSDLKRNRTDADYHNLRILPAKCAESIILAKKINTILARIFV